MAKPTWIIVSGGPPRFSPSVMPNRQLLFAVDIVSIGGVSFTAIPSGLPTATQERCGTLIGAIGQRGDEQCVRIRRDITPDQFIWQKG